MPTPDVARALSERSVNLFLQGRPVDALISERVYKKAWPLERARQHIEAQAGTHFDPDCVAAFVSRWSDIVVLIAENPPESAAA